MKIEKLKVYMGILMLAGSLAACKKEGIPNVSPSKVITVSPTIEPIMTPTPIVTETPVVTQTPIITETPTIVPTPEVIIQPKKEMLKNNYNKNGY